MAVRTTIRVFRHMRKRSAIATSARRPRPGYTRVRATSSSAATRPGPENTPGRSRMETTPGPSLAPCGGASPGILWLERIHAEERPERRRPPARADRRQSGTIGNVQRRMVEGRLLEAHAVVGEGEHEGHQGVLVALAQAEWTDLAVRERGAEVTAAIVEVAHLAQRPLVAVVEVGTVQLHVAQPRRLEHAVALQDVAGVVGDRPHAGVEEALQRIARGLADARHGQLGIPVALLTASLAGEHLHAGLLLRREG